MCMNMCASRKGWPVYLACVALFYYADTEIFLFFFVSFFLGLLKPNLNHVETVPVRHPPNYGNGPAGLKLFSMFVSWVKTVFNVCELSCILGLISSNRQISSTSKERSARLKWFSLTRGRHGTIGQGCPSKQRLSRLWLRCPASNAVF